MEQVYEFMPAKGYPSLAKAWKGNVTGLVFVFAAFAGPLLAFGLPAALWLGIPAAPVLVILLVILGSRYPVRVTISGTAGTFTYRYLDPFGREKETVVSLLTAKVSYRKVNIGRTGTGYRLTLYNRYFGKKVSLEERTSGKGFTRAQLDQMARIVSGWSYPKAAR